MEDYIVIHIQSAVECDSEVNVQRAVECYATINIKGAIRMNVTVIRIDNKLLGSAVSNREDSIRSNNSYVVFKRGVRVDQYSVS